MRAGKISWSHYENAYAALLRERQIDVLLSMPLNDARQQIAPGMASLTQAGEKVPLRASLHSLDMIARVLIGLGCPLEIMNPPELCTTFLDIAAELTRYANTVAKTGSA